MPDRTFHDFGASKSGDPQILCSSETPIAWFWGSEIVNVLSGATHCGLRYFIHTCRWLRFPDRSFYNFGAQKLVERLHKIHRSPDREALKWLKGRSVWVDLQTITSSVTVMEGPRFREIWQKQAIFDHLTNSNYVQGRHKKSYFLQQKMNRQIYILVWIVLLNPPRRRFILVQHVKNDFDMISRV